MQIKRLFLLCSLPVVVTGCAGLYDSQPPAPVYGNNTPIYGNKPAPQQQPKTIEQAQPTQQQPIETVTTAPLKGAETIIGSVKELKPEVLPSGQSLLTPAQEQELSALQQQPAIQELEPDIKPEPKPKIDPKTSVITEPQEPAPQQPTSTTFQPLDTFKSTTPAVNSLIIAANEDSQKGNIESATMTLERASSIEPRNAGLYYKLALLKLKSKPSQAEDLAKKSAQLAANDPTLKKHSWLLVAKARELQKNFQGAQEARDKASKF